MWSTTDSSAWAERLDSKTVRHFQRESVSVQPRFVLAVKDDITNGKLPYQQLRDRKMGLVAFEESM